MAGDYQGPNLIFLFLHNQHYISLIGTNIDLMYLSCSVMINTMPKSNPNDESVLSSVERALLMVEIIAKNKNLNVTQLARRLNTGKATAFRLARTLVSRDWLVKETDLTYNLGPAISMLINNGTAAVDLRTELALVLERLHEATGETIHLTRLEGRKVMYMEQLVSPQPVLSVATIGDYSPAHCVSPGLAQLAALDEERLAWFLSKPLQRYTESSITDPLLLREELAHVRERGYAINVGGYRPDVGGVGRAILGAQGSPIAAISICVPVYRLSRSKIKEFGMQVTDAALQAERRLGQVVA
jgi:DNA-binding IclR family transcriptional regulator